MKKKNTEGEKKHEKDIKIFTEKEKEMRQYYQERKQKKSQYRRNYYLTHKN